jgi:hypothetical protein
LPRRWWLWLPVFVLAVLFIAAGSYYFTMPAAMFTKDQCAKIKEGMNEQQVEGVLGKPPGYHATRPGVRGVGSELLVESSPEGVGKGDGEIDRAWIGDEGMIVVVFDGRGEVKHKWFADVVPFPDSWPARMRRRLSR